MMFYRDWNFCSRIIFSPKIPKVGVGVALREDGATNLSDRLSSYFSARPSSRVPI